MRARKIDVIVVYKVVSFVSVTQQFNTTTSMGRLTLNVLLSFAQFEREIAGERIRDKGVPLSFTLKSIQQMMGRPTPITWNHRVLLTEEQGEKSYCIHEVHYDEDGSVMGWTQNAIAVFVPSFAELILM